MEADGRAGMAPQRFREKYPRFRGACDDCDAQVTLYASPGHRILGDW